jgi:nucleotide-binding universal stress UspA family protein
MERSESTPATGVVIVGIDGGSGSVHVLRAAAQMAEMSNLPLVVAHVVASSQLANQAALQPSNWSLADVEADLFPDVLEALLDAKAPWTLVTLAGNPALALIRLSQERGARAIVVGADNPGWTSHLRRFSTGSVPNRLAHGQRAPVIIIPEACAKVRERANHFA